MARYVVAVFAVFAVLVLNSCASVHVQSQDFTTGDVVICGNKHATMDDLNAKANEVCKRPPQILRCAEQQYGTHTTSTASAYAYAPNAATASGSSTTKALVGNCCEYQCPRP